MKEVLDLLTHAQALKTEVSVDTMMDGRSTHTEFPYLMMFEDKEKEIILHYEDRTQALKKTDEVKIWNEDVFTNILMIYASGRNQTLICFAN